MRKLAIMIALIGMFTLALGSGAFAAVNSISDDLVSISAVSSIDSNGIVMGGSKKDEKSKSKK